jgi:phosphatidylglycerophosphate synthase
LTSGLSDIRAAPESASAIAARSTTGGAGTAVVLATAPADDGRPAALLPWGDGTVVRRLVGQLEALGVGQTLVLARPAFQQAVQDAVGPAAGVKASATAADDLRTIAATARATAGTLLVLYGELVTHAEALRRLAGPAAGTAILAGGNRRRLVFRVRTRNGALVSAASAYHRVGRPNATFLGVLRVRPVDLETVAVAAEQLAELTADPPEAWRAELDHKIELWRAGAARTADEDEGSDDVGAAPDADDDLEEEDEDAGSAVVPSENDDVRVRTRAAGAPEDVAALLVLGLVRAGVRVVPVYLRRLFWRRPLTADSIEEVAGRLADFDVDRALLDSSVKGTDGFFTTFFVSPYSKHIAHWAAHRGLTPNQVTTFAMLLGALAAAGFATGERWGLIAGAVLLQISFTADCVDGQLARYTGQFSRTGAWLDAVFDRAKEYLAFAGLAIGAAHMGDDVWLLACAAITLQTVRHTAGFSFMIARGQVTEATRQPPLERALDDAAAAAEARAAGRPVASPERRPLAERALRSWKRLDRRPAIVWFKRMAAFPIGERFAVISITAALFTPRVTFIALLAWGGFALVYGEMGRVLRSMR